MSGYSRDSSFDELTPRQRHILELMAEGHSNEAISQQVYVSLRTIESHIRSIYMTLGLPWMEDINPRVVAVLAYLERRDEPAGRSLAAAA